MCIRDRNGSIDHALGVGLVEQVHKDLALLHGNAGIGSHRIAVHELAVGGGDIDVYKRQGQGVVVILAALGDLGLLVSDGHIGTACLMSSQQSVEVVVDGDVGIAHDHILLLQMCIRDRC